MYRDKAELEGVDHSEQIVVFEDWERVMKETVPVALHGAYREAVVKFRYWLREKGEATFNIQYLGGHL